MARKNHDSKRDDLKLFTCPHEDCSDFNRFGAENLSVCEFMGKNKAIRRLYCSTCGHRFSERRGTLMQHTKLSEETVVRVVKCLGHGCSLEATADICEIDARTVESVLERAGKRAEDFHQLQLDRREQSPEAVQMDELLRPRESHGGEKRGASADPEPAGTHRRLGRVWVHAALSVTTRFVLALHVGPRTLEAATHLVAAVGMCCRGDKLPLLLVDNHLPYPKAILQVFGVVQHRRRRGRRRRKKQPRLKAPEGLLVGVVHKIRDAAGNLLQVKTKAMFGRLKTIRQKVVALGIGQDINTAHVERLNGTIRGQQARLARRTRSVSRDESCLAWALAIWQDLYNWTRTHRTLGCTPAMAERLTDHCWTVAEYIRYPVHVSELQSELRAEHHEKRITSALECQKP